MIRASLSDQSLPRAVYAVLAIGVAGMVVYGSPSTTQFGLVAAVTAAFGLADLTPLRLPRGGQLVLGGGVATAAVAMLEPAAAIGSMLVGSVAAAAIRDTPPSPRWMVLDVLRRTTGFGVALWAFSVASHALGSSGPGDPRAAMAGLLAGACYMLIDLATFALIDSLRYGRAVLRSFRRISLLVGGVYLSQVFVGAATTVVYSNLRLLSFAILVALMLLLQSSFMSFLKVREAYTRTLSALAQLAECQAPGRSGHSERVASLATAIGRAMHLRSKEVSVLSYAALLHDVGDSCGSDSCPVCEGGQSQSPEELFDSIPYLTGAGTTIGSSIVPYELLESTDASARLLGGILRVACAFDAMESGITPMPQSSALESLAVESGSSYDPAALQALRTVLVRRGVVQP